MPPSSVRNAGAADVAGPPTPNGPVNACCPDLAESGITEHDGPIKVRVQVSELQHACSLMRRGARADSDDSRLIAPAEPNLLC